MRLFVYGTLKRGFRNHDRFCRGVLTVEDAVVRGRLFETSSEIPVLLVLEEDILAVGSTDPLADVATQAYVAARMRDPEPTPDRLEGFRPGGSCLYRRALVPVRIKETVLPTWLHAVGGPDFEEVYTSWGSPAGPGSLGLVTLGQIAKIT